MLAGCCSGTRQLSWIMGADDPDARNRILVTLR